MLLTLAHEEAAIRILEERTFQLKTETAQATVRVIDKNPGKQLSGTLLNSPPLPVGIEEDWPTPNLTQPPTQPQAYPCWMDTM